MTSYVVVLSSPVQWCRILGVHSIDVRLIFDKRLDDLNCFAFYSSVQWSIDLFCFGIGVLLIWFDSLQPSLDGR